MMARPRRRGPLVRALFLVGSGGEAHGGCGWVLWMMGESSPWHVFQAFSTREGCITAMHQQAKAIDKRALRVTQDMSGSSMANAHGRILCGECLPDTVDPRGLKGK